MPFLTSDLSLAKLIVNEISIFLFGALIIEKDLGTTRTPKVMRPAKFSSFKLFQQEKKTHCNWSLKKKRFKIKQM